MTEWIINNYIEIIAAILGVTGVWLTTRQIVWCWPVGLMNVTLSMIVFFDARLYYDFILQIFYFGLTLYGWYKWVFGKGNQDKLPVTVVSKTLLSWGIIILVLSVPLLGYVAAKYTNASLPYWDAFTTAGGIIATFWMARKILENWLAWIVIDIVCTFVYLYKELYAFSVLYFIFTILAVIGYVRWKKDLKVQT
jgi:nicotinamide mononucleotide transporter